MIEKAAKRNQFNWLLSLYAAVAALIMFVPLATYSAYGDILYCLVVPIVSLGLLIVTICMKGRHRLSMLSMLVVYCAVSWALVRSNFEVRTAGRWFLWSKEFKAEVLAQPDSANGKLKHIEWDGSGFPGAGDTVVYLVFDPNNTLSKLTNSQSGGKSTGLPCDVYRVRRLESKYYAVLFYTDTDWNDCN